MDNGEVAHIEAASTSLNNSPDNLVFVCPRHHTKYDRGFAPASNVTQDIVRAAKEMKRASRRRMLLHEGNTAAALRTTLRMVERIETKATDTEDDLLREAYTTEIRSLIHSLPDLLRAAERATASDRNFSDAGSAVLGIAPNLAKAARAAALSARTEADVRSAAQQLVRNSASILELDEVDCPHCVAAAVRPPWSATSAACATVAVS
jgi:hypothetical protein